MPKPEHVRSGAFQVDRARALATLSKRRFKTPAIFADCFLRCAEAAGATQSALGEKGFELTFDQDVPGASGDPWAPIFDPKPRTAAAAELMSGVLACLPTEPTELFVETGGRRLTAKTLEDARWSEPSVAKGKTTIRVQWMKGLAPSFKERLSPERFWFSRGWFPLEAVRPGKPEIFAEAERGRVRLRLLPRPTDAHHSLVHVYRHGVRADTFQALLPVSACVHVDDDLTELSIDLERHAPGERWAKVKPLVVAGLSRLVSAIAAWHRPRFQRVAERLHQGGPANLWGGRVAFSPAGEDLLSAWTRLAARTPAKALGIAPDEYEELVLSGWLADWLHAAPERGLEDAPLFFAGNGRTTTLRELRNVLERDGVVGWSRCPGDAPVWCPSAREIAWLTRHFGASLRQV
ncbi:MAG: hypothetical protein HY925_13865 [Elusimicrobia bacterium]|nr:hypothetical protein [Elusimicrobiota bacterium]